MNVTLRTWKTTDAKSLVSALSNKKVLNNLRDGLPYPYTEKDALEYINFILASNAQETFAYAIDVDGAPYTYTETSTKIQDTDEVEDISVLRARLEDSETAVKILFGEDE